MRGGRARPTAASVWRSIRSSRCLPLAAALPSPGLAEAGILTRVALVVYGVMAGFSAWWILRHGERSLLALRHRGAPLERFGLGGHLFADLGLGLLVGLAVVVMSHAWLTRWSWARFLEERLREILTGLRAGQALLLALLSGIAEELLFRGVLLPPLLARFGVPGGLLLGALLFGVVHVGPDRRFLGWTAFAFGMGIALGALALGTGSLVAPIACHVQVNALNLLHEVWERRLFPAGGPSVRVPAAARPA